jgi:cyclase
MLKKRIIPTLLLKDGRMVKGKNFSRFRDVGNPVTAARVYNAQKADELVFLDIEPTMHSRRLVYGIIEEAAAECFMPLTVGGGVQSCEDIKDLLDAGADKVSINSAAVRNPELIREGAQIFGDQCIVVSVDYKTLPDGSRRVYIDSGSTQVDLDPWDHIRHCVDLGAGEILLTSIDHEGAMQGYDLEFIKMVSAAVNVPVIANGGAGRLEDFKGIFTETRASAVAAGSIFHFTDQSPIKTRFFLSNSGIDVRV